MNELEKIKTEIEKRLNSRTVSEQYRHGIRFTSKKFNEKLYSDISEALEMRIVFWLIENGYQPADDGSFLEVMADTFDFGNVNGIAVKVEAIIADDTLPINARILFALLKKNRQLRFEIRSRDHVLGLLRPQWLTNLVCKVVGMFRNRRFHSGYCEDDDE